jgi:hypothetical protein
MGLLGGAAPHCYMCTNAGQLGIKIEACKKPATMKHQHRGKQKGKKAAPKVTLVIPSLLLTTTFPLWKTALRHEVTQPSPLVWGSELARASMVQSGIWEIPMPWKMVLMPEGTTLWSRPSRVRHVIWQVLEVWLTLQAHGGTSWGHSWLWACSCCLQQAATLPPLLPHSNVYSCSGGSSPPLPYLMAWLHSQANYHTLLGLCSPYHQPCSLHEALIKGGPQSVCLIHQTLI